MSDMLESNLTYFYPLQYNTDGLSFVIKKSELNLAISLFDKLSNIDSIPYEYIIYDKMIINDVNNYIAIDVDGNVKTKGVFEDYNDIIKQGAYHKDTSAMIIPKALKAYYIENIPVKQFVESHTNILDFCCSQKVDKSYHIEWTSPQFVKSKQQRLNRFYASTKGGYIYKCRNGKQNHLLKESGVMIYNNHDPNVFPTDINYKFYIAQINKIISEISNKNQLTLF